MTLLIFGSLNMDLVTRTPRLPMPGETLTGLDFTTIPGGKGGNQAVAVARLGVPAKMVGRVGADNLGHELLHSLQQAGVQTDGVLIDHSVHSGIAAIAVDQAGENHIILVPGANGHLDQADVERLKPLLPNAKALLLQLEVPLSSVQLAAQAAHEAGVPVILDPAPAHGDLPSSLYPYLDIITPNQIEAGQLVGFPVQTFTEAEHVAHALQDRGVKTVIIKFGARGALCVTPDETFQVPAYRVKAVDTVAAGDAFNGGLAAALAEGRSLRDAVLWGNAVAALSVMRPGAQPSMPHRSEVEAFLEGSSVAQ